MRLGCRVAGFIGCDEGSETVRIPGFGLEYRRMGASAVRDARARSAAGRRILLLSVGVNKGCVALCEGGTHLPVESEGPVSLDGDLACMTSLTFASSISVWCASMCKGMRLLQRGQSLVSACFAVAMG